ncbi:MAG TPA: DUF1062 domain-containing protein [Hyphomicrobiaceae bacterium]|jgi:hypothetical protein
MPFRSSGKLRINANGKRLDAWLIYRCSACERTWNRPIIERRNARDMDPALLRAIRSGDPDWIRAQAFDVSSLKRQAQRIDESADVEVLKALLGEDRADWTVLEIALIAPHPTSLRLDRLLSTELNLSRSELQNLHDAGKLRVDPDRKHMLRRPVRHSLRITVDNGAPDGDGGDRTVSGCGRSSRSGTD